MQLLGDLALERLNNRISRCKYMMDGRTLASYVFFSLFMGDLLIKFNLHIKTDLYYNTYLFN